jgi:sRNA-binding regulator protein Hfq
MKRLLNVFLTEDDAVRWTTVELMLFKHAVSTAEIMQRFLR